MAGGTLVEPLQRVPFVRALKFGPVGGSSYWGDSGLIRSSNSGLAKSTATCSPLSWPYMGFPD